MTPNQQDINQALNKAKIQLMSRPDSAFFTTVCFSLKHVWDSNILTAATDGKCILLNPDFFMKQNPEQRIGLLLHETLHVAYLHMIRKGSRDHSKYNIAADHVINLQLLERGFRLPESRLADSVYSGMSTEQVYDLLPDTSPADYTPDVIETTDTSEELSKEIQDIVIRAAIQSKIQEDKPGSIPSDIQIFLDRLLNPKLPWQRILQKYLHNTAKNDYTFRKPNRRYFPEYYLPSLYSERLMNIAIAIDTSGSVSDEEFKQFVSEIHSIMKMMKPEKITLIQFDKKIHSITELRNLHDLLQCKFVGRGGTDIDPVINWANVNKPQLLMTFTDGKFRFYNHATKLPVVWLINNNPGFTAPFGKVIHYEI